MGRDVPALVFTREDRRRYRIKMQECLEVFAQMLRESRFEAERPQVGLEIELNLVDDRAEPAMRNTEVLEAIADPAWDTELGRFNLEINVPPRRLTEGGPDAWGVGDPRLAQPRRRTRPLGRRASDHGRHPAHAAPGARR